MTSILAHSGNILTRSDVVSATHAYPKESEAITRLYFQRSIWRV